MPAKPRKPARSPAQRQGSAALTQVMNAWEALSDEDRLVWRTDAATRRRKGIALFKQVNLRRLRRGEELSRLPPVAKVYDGKPILKRLLIYNRGDQLTLKLELRRAPTAPTTVWGALPCNRGRERPDKCPRLGWLSEAVDGVCDITRQYYEKFGEHLKVHSVQLTGKRIFIRTRRESDEGPPVFEEVKAVVPPPEGPRKSQKPLIPFEAPS